MALGFQAMRVGLMMAAPLLLTALITGLIVSLLQASTQINEMTLSFIPKILAVSLTVICFGSWMLGELVDYVHTLFSQLPYMVS